MTWLKFTAENGTDLLVPTASIRCVEPVDGVHSGVCTVWFSDRDARRVQANLGSLALRLGALDFSCPSL